MSLKIIVLAKQVPDTRNVGKDAMTAEGTVNRAALPAIFNPEDLNALEQALRLKEQNPGSTVGILTMGPPRAAEIIRQGLYRGADTGWLLTDRLFAGADTLATSYALATAIKKIGGADVVIGGRQAIDGDTAQVGPGVSEFLEVPLITYVKSLELIPEGYRVVTQMDDGEHVIEGKFPAVMTVLKEASTPRFAPLAGWMAAAKAEIAVLDEKDVAADPIRIGLKGSPTKVVTIFPPPVKGGGEKVDARGDGAKGAKAIAAFLAKKGLVK